MPTGATEQTDLSGTYTGTFDCSDAGASGETTLTITGNQFTLSDGKSGRIVAATTHGYTGVTMQFGELTRGTQPGTAPIIVSMRARKSGDRLTLTTVPGATHVCSFTPAGSSRGARARHRRGRAAIPATPAEPAAPAEPSMTPATPPEPATPAAPVRRGRRGRRGRSSQNMNSNSNMNDNTGTRNEGNMNATPTPTPAVHRN
ncbi:MAG TPA: hypothetical protein DHU55_06845 [Blastocatellia bacterium]|nr:hypothetical protein [Blastocatellia bacterium]